MGWPMSEHPRARAVAVPEAIAAPEALEIEIPSERSDVPKYVFLGLLSGTVIGFFGIGASWMLAPVLSATSNSNAPERRGHVVPSAFNPVGPGGALEGVMSTS